MKCTMCDGSGQEKVYDKLTNAYLLIKCAYCNGTGEVEKTEQEYIQTCNTEQFKDIKTYICDMLVYCDVISSKDSTAQSKIAFVHLMGNVAKRIADKCDKLEKELENEQAHRESCG